MKLSLLTLLVTLSFLTISCSQEGVKFEMKFLPDRTYTATMTTSSSSIMDIQGDEEFINQIKANGTTLPMIMESKQELTTITSTGSMNSVNEFSMRTLYDISSSQIINGKEQEVRQSPIKGMVAFGRVLPTSKLKIDSLVGPNVTEHLNITLTQILEGVLDQMTYPDEPINIGDSFEQKIPMSIPVADLNPVKVIITINRTLRKVENGKAYFDLTQEVGLDFELEQGDVRASGSGTGNSVYDLNYSFTTVFKTKLDMVLVVKTDVLEITVNIKSSTSNFTEIENN